ncbi:MAG: hypothetical protein KDA92_15495 [Planctomycetales bacterium]|nr:hypothetical protein [Planctomycetales bacterium]
MSRSGMHHSSRHRQCRSVPLPDFAFQVTQIRSLQRASALLAALLLSAAIPALPTARAERFVRHDPNPAATFAGFTSLSPTEREEIEQLVSQLGAERFSERQAASLALQEVGTPAIESLRAVEDSADPEVRQRARHLLRAIRMADRQRLIAAFLAGVSVIESELPGWSDFHDRVGMSPATRKIYVKMLEEEWALLEAADESDAAVTSRHVSGRILQLTRPLRTREKREISLGSVATVLALADRDEIQLRRHAEVFTLCYRSTEFNEALSSAELREPLIELMNRLVLKDANQTYLTSQLHFALQYKLTAGLAAARQVVAERSGIPHVRQYAIFAIGKMGDEQDLTLLENLLDDDGIVTSHNRVNGERITTQVRDIALAMLIHRHQEKFADYGMPNVKENPTTVISVQGVGFASGESRAQAIEKWRQRDTTLSESEQIESAPTP